jgi:hypothetical protein
MLPKAAHIRISQSYGKVNRTVVLRTTNKAKNVTVSKNVLRDQSQNRPNLGIILFIFNKICIRNYAL